MGKSNEKTYSLRGKVTKVYEPREIVMNYGGKKVVKEVSDLYLQLDAGAKVKVSFWDTDISHHEGAVVVVSCLVFKGKYKDIPQYSSTRETKISVTKKGAAAPVEADEEQPEGATLEAEPTFGADGTPEEEVPEGAVEEGAAEESVPEETPVEEPAPVKAKAVAKPAAVAKPKVAVKATAKVVDAGYVVSPEAIAITVALAKAANEIVNDIAPKTIAENPQALQALFATIFINLGLKDYSSKGGRG
jgi:hypothetical protein